MRSPKFKLWKLIMEKPKLANIRLESMTQLKQ